MFFSPFLASRYLKPKRTFVSIITLISILGVALGVWAMIVVNSVFTGYGVRIRESILGVAPHLVIESGGFMKGWPETYEKVKAVEDIESVTPFVTGQVVMDFGGRRSAPWIRGILPPEGKELERMQSKLTKRPNPEFPLDPEKMIRDGDFIGENDFYSAVVGSVIAEGNNIKVGDKILLYSNSSIDAVMASLNAVEGATDEGDRKKGIEEIREMTAPQELVVKGIFDSGNWDFDATVVFVHLETAQVLYGFDLDECHGIAARTEDPFKADQLQAKLHEILPQQFAVRTWAQINKTIFDAVAAERQMMFLILFIIMIVGSFGIMSTMITVTVQKRTEIGILKALGSREGQIAWVFLFQGILVGLVGVFAGFGLAQLTIWKRNDIAGWVGQRFGVEFFNAEMYKIDGGIPSVQTPADLTVITISALVCCTLAALVPAVLAAFLQPAKALRSQ